MIPRRAGAVALRAHELVEQRALLVHGAGGLGEALAAVSYGDACGCRSALRRSFVCSVRVSTTRSRMLSPEFGADGFWGGAKLRSGSFLQLALSRAYARVT